MPQFARHLVTPILAVLLATGALRAQESVPAGPYIAGRHAMMQNDFAAAARHLERALAQDPNNGLLLENALVANIGLGEIARAAPFARRLTEVSSGNQIAALALLADAAIAGRYDEIVAGYEAGAAVSPLIDGLLHAWALAGAGRMSDALDRFDAVAEQPPLRMLGAYHKALALASVGDFEAANAVFEAIGEEAQGLGRGALAARVQILSQAERGDEALALLDALLDGESDPQFEQMRGALARGEHLPFDRITDARQGMGEVLFALAGAVDGEVPDTHSLLYARFAQALHPGNLEIVLQVAELLERLERYELATQAYEQVPREHPLFHTAEIGRADALFATDKPDAAVEVLKTLARTHADVLSVHVALGDALRRLERYAEAAVAYDAAIGGLEDDNPRYWFLYYSRGIARERTGEWDGAEADFRKALAMDPEQPLVLNYLGYSLVERREQLDEALAMIEQAAASRPQDGFITDSLGWVYYRLGRYDEAVTPMERAVELEPTDPIINDHLGDVYWMVGRRLEARFQWQRALSFDPEPEEAARISRKLELGLDAVLREEGDLAVTRNED